MHKRRCQHERAERLLEGFRTSLLLLPRIPCPYQKFHPTLGEMGIKMLICDD
jgi:hypothetical protein